MVTLLGYYKKPDSDYVSVYVKRSFTRAGVVGEQVDSVDMKLDDFESQFSHVEIGDQVSLSVRYDKIPLKTPVDYIWKAHFSVG